MGEGAHLVSVDDTSAEHSGTIPRQWDNERLGPPDNQRE